jgi:hypothetical protein
MQEDIRATLQERSHQLLQLLGDAKMEGITPFVGTQKNAPDSSPQGQGRMPALRKPCIQKIQK